MRYRFRQDPASLSFKLARLLLGMYSGDDANTEASEPRDRIFALLGMASDHELLRDFGVIPDYRKSTTLSDIYTRTAGAIVKSGDVDLLGWSNSSDCSSMPSWVPDWQRPLHWSFRDNYWDTAFAASGDSKPPEIGSPHHANFNPLVLQGYHLDVVEAAQALCEPIDDPPDHMRRFLQQRRTIQPKQRLLQTGQNRRLLQQRFENHITHLLGHLQR